MVIIADKDKEEMEIDVQELSRAAQERLAFHERRAAEAELRAGAVKGETGICFSFKNNSTMTDAQCGIELRAKKV